MKGTVYIVMGVSGCGKSTIGKMLAERLGVEFYDADDFHPPANISKMSAGIPLTDEDRQPWLEEMREKFPEWSKTGAVLACSALKEQYREILAEADSTGVEFIYLDGNFELIYKRMSERSGHFMAGEMLQSQFAALEVPTYGIQVKIDQPPEAVVEEIILKMSQGSFIGVIGLGVMGSSLAMNILDKGYALSVYNRVAPGEEKLVDSFMDRNSGASKLEGFTELEPFLGSLAKPRRILLMIKAGPAVDQVVAALEPHLEAGDIVIDAGNSHFEDTIRRERACAAKDFNFVGMGVSGGEEGALKGPSMMVGGTEYAYGEIGELLEAIAARDVNGASCCTRVGPDGAGHFVKMIHNGIEYAEMQLLAEVYALLKASHTNEEISSVLADWLQGEQASFLLEATADILRHRTDDAYTLDLILDKAANKGTGGWSSKAALDLGQPTSMMTEAVLARYVSSQKAERKGYAARLTRTGTGKVDVSQLRNAFSAARILNHHQGFELIREASQQHNWLIDLAELARIWTNGCIIRSELMRECAGALRSETLLDHFFDKITSAIPDLKSIVIAGVEQDIPLPCLQAALTYWQGMTTEKLPANLIQAQRDYFGAHTYRRTDHPETTSFHTDWKV